MHAISPIEMMDLCKLNKCQRPAKTRGYCGMHYQRLRNSGRIKRLRPTTTQGFEDMARQKLRERVTKDPKTECLLWQGATVTNGYGAITMNNEQYMTHRLAWSFAKGPIPSDLYVLHKCDVRRCINIDHLYLGTQLDNMRDMVRRTLPKKWAHSSKLSRDAVLAIRSDKRKHKLIAADYAISASYVSLIKTGRALRWIK